MKDYDCPHCRCQIWPPEAIYQHVLLCRGKVK